MRPVKKFSVLMGAALTAVVLAVVPAVNASAATPQNGWYEENGKKYWYEGGVRQGAAGKDKEIYDPGSKGWYCLSGKNGGAVITGWYTSAGSDGKEVTHYYDPQTGKMVYGSLTIDGKPCVFDNITGVALDCAWNEENGVKYWYEKGVRQGLEGRGKEIYDPASDAWYWLDSIDKGKMAVSKDVYQEDSFAGFWGDIPNGDGTTHGKWVRYDANGHMIKGEHVQDGARYRFEEITGAMIKGWYTTQDANGKEITYYYDKGTGKMCFGAMEIDGKPCIFDEHTGIALDCVWREENGVKYWYEKGVRQGLDGRGKEIYDPASNAWYWLDSIDKGKMAVNKDVYQESFAGPWGDIINADGTTSGKWVRYDANGHMIKGEHVKDGAKYRFDEMTGAMIKGWYYVRNAEGKVTDTYYYNKEKGYMQVGSVTVDGKSYMFDSDGKMRTGWIIVGDKKYYYDPSTGIRATGIVTIEGTEESFDENTGVYKGRYEGASYSWVMTKATLQNADGSVRGSVKYEYEDNGLLRSKTAYFANGRDRKNRHSYTYDAAGNISRHVYQDFTDPTQAQDYSENYTYVDGRLTREEKRDKNDALIQIIEYVYNKDGKLSRSNVRYGNGNLKCYTEYELNSKGDITKEKNYNDENTFTGYVRKTYYASYNGQNFLKSSILYGADDKYISGEEYVMNGSEIREEIIYGESGVINQRTVYDNTTPPNDKTQTTFKKESNTYDRDNRQIYHTIFEYELKDFVQ